MVRSKEQILATLDKDGQLDSLPFMPQMFKYCGKRFQIYKRAHKTCDTIVHNWDCPGRSLRDGIHLNLRCDGASYGGCQAACLIFWKEAWLAPAEEPELTGVGPGTAYEGCLTTDGDSVDSEFLKTTRTGDLDARGEPRYACQATKLLEYTKPLPWWDARQYVEDYTSGNASIGEMLRGFLWQSYYWGTLAFSRKYGKPARWLYDKFQSFRGGLPYPRHRGTIPPGKANQTAALNLRPGELVRIKSYEEILATLDTNNKNAGMAFDGEQMPYCGGVYRVRVRVEKFIDEKTGYMRRMKTPAVILDGVYCRARYSDYRMFCPRSIFSWWREIWLERIEDPARPASHENNRRIDSVDPVAGAARAGSSA
jgi:hypothetical protein